MCKLRNINIGLSTNEDELGIPQWSGRSHPMKGRICDAGNGTTREGAITVGEINGCRHCKMMARRKHEKCRRGRKMEGDECRHGEIEVRE